MNTNDMIDEVCKSLQNTPEDWVVVDAVITHGFAKGYKHKSGLSVYSLNSNPETLVIGGAEIINNKISNALLKYNEYHHNNIHRSSMQIVDKELAKLVNFDKNKLPEPVAEPVKDIYSIKSYVSGLWFLVLLLILCLSVFVRP